jgi:hypothetical protein
MSPRAASRLETLGYGPVYDYVGGKADWGSAGLPLEGINGSETRAGSHVRTDVRPASSTSGCRTCAAAPATEAGTPASSSTTTVFSSDALAAPRSLAQTTFSLST